MVRRIQILGLLVLIVALAACGGSQADTTTGDSETAQNPRANQTPGAWLSEDMEMPLSMRLPVGTLLLEETAYAVTPEQAEELLPLWQMLRALQESGTSSQVEVEAVYDQIQEAMTSEQLAAIEEMNQEDMRSLFEELGMGRQSDSSASEGDEGERGGFAPPDGGMGMMPGPEGGGEGMMMGPGGPGGFGELSEEEQATAMAGRAGGGMGFGTGMIDAVIELLEMRAAEA
jgi:hypothetical protein